MKRPQDCLPSSCVSHLTTLPLKSLSFRAGDVAALMFASLASSSAAKGLLPPGRTLMGEEPTDPGSALTGDSFFTPVSRDC